MREIKFRAKCLEQPVEGEWIYGYLADENYIADINSPALTVLEVSPETIGQYTGLKDKNGKEIYEGDIIKGRYGWHHIIIYKENIASFVALIHSCGRFDDYNYCAVTQKWIDDFNKVVIGNIHDNPELLKPNAETPNPE